MREKGTASAACGLFAIAAALGLCLPSCLPALDEGLVSGNLCRGGVPDGFLDPSEAASGSPAEECDDGNSQDGDGCDQRCRVECPSPGVQDPRTHHCYVVTAPHVACGTTLPGSKLVTIRSDGERDVVSSLLAGRADSYLTAYTVVLNQTVGLGAKVTVDSAVTSSIYAEPGMLSKTTPAGLFECSGCYYGRSSTFWPADQKKTDVVVVDAAGDFGTVHADALTGMSSACERPPSGDAHGCSGSCATGATSEKRLQAPGASSASTYSYFGARTTRQAAETTCVSLGGHLLWLESEEEREMVFRYFATDFQLQSFTWIGLARVDGVFTWSDGAVDGGGRPYFWSATPPCAALDCAGIVSTSDSFATGLVQGIPCAGGNGCGTTTFSAQQPFMCKRSTP